MRVGFTKVEGLGNDFVLFDGRALDLPPPNPALATALCDRHRGIGADGVLTLHRSSRADARLTIWNADGSEAEMCGNGLRCAAELLFGDLGPREISVETLAGVHRCRPAGPGLVWVELLGLQVGEAESVALPQRTVTGRVVRIGNPHFVLREASLDEAEILGPALERAPRFAPARTNVELCAVAGAGLRVRVWERGVGLTQACGTGAAAAAAAAWADGHLPRGPTRVELPGGAVQIEPLAPDRLALTGPARSIFSGQIDLG